MRRRAGQERGVAVVELAFVSLIIAGIVASTIDFGLSWHSGMAINESARTGARVGSGQAKSIAADYNALSGVQASLRSAGKLDDVELVVIYRANHAGGSVPASCKSLTPSGTCNVLTGDQLAALSPSSFNIVFASDPEDPPTGGTGCLQPGSSLLAGWCPPARNNNQSSADFYGVYIKYRQTYLSPIMGDGLTIEREAVMRLEPPSI